MPRRLIEHVCPHNLRRPVKRQGRDAEAGASGSRS